MVHRPASRQEKMSRRLVGMMSAVGRWVAPTTMTATARPRATMSRRSAEKFHLSLVADRGGEVGNFVDGQDECGHVVTAFDLAALAAIR